MVANNSLFVDYHSEVQDNESVCITSSETFNTENCLIIDTKGYLANSDDIIVLNLQKENFTEVIQEVLDHNFINKLHSIPNHMTDEELIKIQKFVKESCQLKKGQCKIYAYSLLADFKMDLHLTLLVVNKDNTPVEIGDFPIKIYDANDKLIVDGRFNVNTSTYPEKISIKTITIKKEELIDRDIDLNAWRVIF